MSAPKHAHSEFHKGIVPADQLPPTLYMLLTNKSGASVALGDVVIVSTANDEAFTTTTSAGNTKPIGIAAATIANNATGLVAVNGYVGLVTTTGSVTRGHYAETSTTAKKAQGNATREAGSFAIFLKGGTTPSAWLFGVPDMGGGGGSSLTVEEVDGSPTDSAVTKIVFPNGTLSITAHVVTYTPAGGGGGTMSAKGRNTGADTITTFSEQKVTIGDDTLWDDWSTMASGDDFVVPTGQGGTYRAVGNCELSKHGGAAPTTGWVEVSIRDSAGTTFYAIAGIVLYTALLVTDQFALCSADFELADGDSISLWVNNNMDRSVDLNNGSGPYCASLAIEKLS